MTYKFEAGTRQSRIHEIIFEADTLEGKVFDIVLLVMIVVSIIAVSWESLPNLAPATKRSLYIIEWILTIFFTIEYALRIISVKRPWKYITSFYGLVDLLSILPTYLSILIPGTNTFLVIRSLRLLRLFRVFKMVHFLDQGNILMKSIRSSVPKMTVFVYFVLVMVCIFGATMYVVEGQSNEQFDSIPRAIYQAIVTITTVGFGDITPQTAMGQFLSAILMIVGYAVIAVPTGIVSAEFVNNSRGGRKKKKNIEKTISTQACRYCSREGHDEDAIYCKYCGERIHEV